MKQETLFNEKLKYLRKERKISQVALAQAIGVSKGTISLWENGLREPILSNLVALAEFFSVDINYFVSPKDY